MTDYVWDSPEAKQAVFNLLKNHDSQRRFVEFLTRDKNTLSYIRDLATSTRKLRPGLMFRIIDVKQTLEKISYEPGIQGSFTFIVEDNQCPWNNNLYEVKIEAGKAGVTSVDQNQSSIHNSIDFRCDIGILSQLVAGYLSYEELIESSEILRLSDSDVPSQAFPKQFNLPRDYF